MLLNRNKTRLQPLTMSEENIQYADIHGRDFSGADLSSSNFKDAKTGQRPLWIAFILIFLLFLSVLSGGMVGYASGLAARLISVKSGYLASGIISLITLVIFIGTVIRNGFSSFFSGLTLLTALLVGSAAAISNDGNKAVIGIIVLLLILAAAIAGAVVGAIVSAVTLILFDRRMIAVSGFGFLFIAASIIGTLEAAGLPISSMTAAIWGIAGTVTLSMLGAGFYIGKNAALKDERYLLVHKISLFLASIGGTQFCSANLTNADFTGAFLKSSDFRNANLHRTCWFQSTGLEYARVDGTYLENTVIRQLVTSKDGREQNYDQMNLRGLNLDNAQLAGASLIGADLSGATMRNADLSKAKLMQAQLYGADLTGTCLTGAFIQDWAIALDTCLEKISCEYIYMRLPTSDNPDAWRKPDNRDELFKEGDFSDFIAPIIKTLDLYTKQNIDIRDMASTFKTLDLYHHEGIDPQAAAIALKQVAEQHPEANLEIVALEGRGKEKVRLQAVVADASDQSRLSSEYFEKYKQISSLPYKDMQALLAGMVEKDERIRSLEKMVQSAISSNKFYVETRYAMGEKMKKIKVLFLAANPAGTTQLQLDEEIRQITTKIRAAEHRDALEVIPRFAIRADDLLQALLEHKPHIVHFSGHGSSEGELIVVDDNGRAKPVSKEALVQLFKTLRDNIRIVLLNACYSSRQAEAIASTIDCTIGMNKEIGDAAAIVFAASFYRAVGFGRSVQEAFAIGKTALLLEGIPEENTPELLLRQDANASGIILVQADKEH